MSMERAIFRNTSRESLGSDRSAGDRMRHREKLRKTFRDNIHDYIGEESIIGKSKDKVIKVPIKGVKEYRFIYGDNNPGVGQGSGDAKPGDVIGRTDEEGKDAKRAGDQPGVDYYETDVTLEELIEIMFEDLELPDMEKKALRYIVSERQARHKGYRHVGIRVRLAKKKTILEHKKREVAAGFTSFSKQFPEKITKEEYENLLEEYADDPLVQSRILTFYYPVLPEREEYELRFPFADKDLIYNYMEPDIKIESNAAVICIMDTSGSMDIMKKYLARAFFFLLYQFVVTKYRAVELVFIAHTTEGKQVTEEEFFHKGESGGTFISSGYAKALEVIAEKYDPALWNNYAVHCSDGDNFESDNPKAIKLLSELCTKCQLCGYIEIKPAASSSYESSMMKIYKDPKNIAAKNFQAGVIKKKDEVWSTFKALMKKDLTAQASEGGV